MSPGALTSLARRASSLFERVEHRTPDVTPPARPRSAPPDAPASTTARHGYNPQRMPRPKWVFRSDDRDPGQIFEQGFTARPPRPGGRYDYDLARHQHGGNAESENPTGFISTTSDPRTTDQWGQGVIRDGRPVTATDANGTIWQLRTNTVYRIENNAHFVDALAQDTDHRYPAMDGQHEYAAPHRVDPRSIDSATTVQQWQHSSFDGVRTWPGTRGPDGNDLPQPQLYNNPHYEAGRPPYNPADDPASGW